jgi:hypothetical protein
MPETGSEQQQELRWLTKKRLELADLSGISRLLQSGAFEENLFKMQSFCASGPWLLQGHGGCNNDGDVVSAFEGMSQ